MAHHCVLWMDPNHLHFQNADAISREVGREGDPTSLYCNYLFPPPGTCQGHSTLLNSMPVKQEVGVAPNPRQVAQGTVAE